MDIRFDGQRALVTGAGRGIGKAIAKALAAGGAETIALSRTQENLDKLKAELLNRPRRFSRGLTLTEVGGGADSASGNDADLDRILNDYLSPSDNEDSPDSDIEISGNENDDDFDLRMTDATAALDQAAADPAVFVVDSASTTTEFAQATAFSISQDRLTALIKWYNEHGISPRVKRSGGRRSNTKALLFDDIKRVVHFIASYTEDHALALPGRILGVWRHGVKLLPSASIKVVVYASYLATFENSVVEMISRKASTRDILHKLLYDDDLAVVADSEADYQERFLDWKEIKRGLRVSVEKTETCPNESEIVPFAGPSDQQDSDRGYTFAHSESAADNFTETRRVRSTRETTKMLKHSDS
ncbi:hypothetical protein LSAT2_004847 [Lamellibrachia satsuma]|nr:hypothetical protein LSAT2_004847 [Lamellibrachia satsuma]